MARTGSAAAYASLREAFSGPAIRALIGLKDTGENFLARVKDAAGGLHYDTEGDQDAWIHYIDELSGYSGIARLHVPGNILFSLPDEDDTGLVVRPAEVNAPGVSYLLHGDVGKKERFPSWFATKVGLFAKKILRLESYENDVEIECGSGKKIKLGTNAEKGVARVGDRVRTPFSLTIANLAGAATVTIGWTDADGAPQALAMGFTGSATLNGQPAAAAQPMTFRGEIDLGSEKILAED